MVALLRAQGGGQLTAEQLRDALQQHLPANMQLRACTALMLPAAPPTPAAPGANVWCRPVAFLAAQAAGPAGRPQELTLHVSQQLLAATAAAGRGVRIVVSDSTQSAVLDCSLWAGDAAWPGDGALRLQLPPCQGPLVLLYLLSTAPAGAAQHAADELLATAALLALPSAPACSEVNSMFDRMQQEVQAQAQGAASELASPAHVFNHQLRAFVMDCAQLLAPGSTQEQQQPLARHMQTFLALQDMRACLQLLRAAGVQVGAQPADPPATVSRREAAGIRTAAGHASTAGELHISWACLQGAEQHQLPVAAALPFAAHSSVTKRAHCSPTDGAARRLACRPAPRQRL